MNSAIDTQPTPQKRYSRLKIAASVLTLFGIGLFAYLVYAVGVWEIFDGVVRFGAVGFAVILFNYFLRICVRSYTWKLSVHEPYRLTMKDTIPAVVIGEALSSTIPLGILISGTSKAIAVRNRIPLVAGFSSVATENLFYSLMTGIYLIASAVILLRGYAVDESLLIAVNFMIVALSIATVLGLLMVIRQWHFASAICNWLYGKGLLQRLLENGRAQVRLFEDLIYGFYRRHPRRFVPICLLEAGYHLLGVVEVWYILNVLNNTNASFMTAFLLESVNRLVIIIFKLIPFSIGVDEAGAQFVGQTVALAAGVGVTLAIIRKGRALFWTAMGWILIAKRGLSFREMSQADPNGGH